MAGIPTTIDMWMRPYQAWQQAANAPFIMYAKIWQIGLFPNPELKGITDEWTKTWNQIGQIPMMPLNQTMQETSNTSDTGSYNYFNEMWEKSWTIGVELFKAYVETIQKFTGQWPTICKK